MIIIPFLLRLILIFLIFMPNLLFAQDNSNPSESFLPLPEIESSIVEIPINLSLAVLRDILDEKIPKNHHFGQESGCHRGQWGIAYRENISLNMVNSTIHWNVPIATMAHARLYAIKSFWGNCIKNTKHCRMRFVIPLQTTLFIDENWQLKTITKKQPLQWKQRCKIRILGIPIGVTGFFEGKLEETLNSKASGIDRRINQEVNFRAFVQKAWRTMQKPIELMEGFQLVLQPEELRSTSITGNQQHATVLVGVKLKAKITTKSPTVIPIPLPNRISTFVGDNFRIALEGGISYDDATRQANKMLSGKHYPVGDKTVTIKRVNKIQGTKEWVSVELTFEGDYSGKASFKGKPTYDANRQEIFLRNFQYNISTKMGKMTDWVVNQFFLENIQRELRWSISQDLAKAKRLTERALNQSFAEKVKIVGRVESIYPKGIYLTPSSIYAHIIATGKAAIHISAMALPHQK
jgi:hypothetical protein